MTELTSKIWVEQVNLASIDPKIWDDMAFLCGGTMRSAHAHIRTRETIFRFIRMYKTFVVKTDFENSPKTIGCFTVFKSSGCNVIYDGLCLAPEYQDRWPEAFRAALAAIGPGLYRYGWAWSFEAPREAMIASVEGAEVLKVESVFVQGVDFSNWPSWDAYYRKISENSRRNAKKAEAKFDDLQLSYATGFAALKTVPKLVALRSAMYKRKDLRFQSFRNALIYIGHFLMCPAQAMVGYVTGGGQMRAAFSLVEFGEATYYVDGAASFESDGAAWYLMLNIVRRAFEKWPKGKFVMGFYHPETGKLPGAAGLMRSRASMRVSEWPTSIVTFRWRPV